MTLNSVKYPNAYEYIKARFCAGANCQHDCDCANCEWGELRIYAARDADRIAALRQPELGDCKIKPIEVKRIEK